MAAIPTLVQETDRREQVLLRSWSEMLSGSIMGVELGTPEECVQLVISRMQAYLNNYSIPF